MKRSIIAFILVILICIPLLASCSKKKDTSGQPTDVPMTEEITQKPTEAPTEEASKPTEPTTPTPEQPSTPSEPEKVVTDYTVADRVYSYYSAGYDMLAVALNANGSPIALELYSKRLFPISSLSFCTIEYDEYGKISAFVFENDSVIHEELFGRCEDITLKVIRHDKKGRPLKTEPAKLVTLSFSYDDDAKTSTMSFTHVRMPGAYTLTFDEFGRLLSLDNFGATSNIVYENSIATVSDPFYSALGVSFVITYDGTKATSLKEVSSDGVDMTIDYTYGDKGLCSSSLCKYSENEAEKNVFSYDKNGRVIKQEYWLSDGVEYTELTKTKEVTYAYDLRGRLTETKTFDFIDAENSYLASLVQQGYGENGGINSLITYTYNQDGTLLNESIVSYYENGAFKMTKYSEYDISLLLYTETFEFDESGRTTHKFISRYDVNNNESESSTAVYTYFDDDNYVITTMHYYYDSLTKQSVDTYTNKKLRKTIEITYSPDGTETGRVETNYDKDGNPVL
ncbi:MAG: hypothetical protein E7642_09125 [Ruminococcaceae bacterium]|nr:hypothetical protein [Oscillospiraceae bacterium]